MEGFFHRERNRQEGSWSPSGVKKLAPRARNGALSPFSEDRCWLLLKKREP